MWKHGGIPNHSLLCTVRVGAGLIEQSSDFPPVFALNQEPTVLTIYGDLSYDIGFMCDNDTYDLLKVLWLLTFRKDLDSAVDS